MFPVAALMDIMPAVPNPLVANPYTVRIRRCAGIINDIGWLIGNIVFPGT
jgi:hypothetical protein